MTEYTNPGEPARELTEVDLFRLAGHRSSRGVGYRDRPHRCGGQDGVLQRQRRQGGAGSSPTARAEAGLRKARSQTLTAGGRVAAALPLARGLLHVGIVILFFFLGSWLIPG